MTARIWTEAQDSVILRMRADGETWAAIAVVLGLSRNTTIERGRRIQATAPAREHITNTPERDTTPLPAGHPATWSLICNEPYPEYAAR